MTVADREGKMTKRRVLLSTCAALSGTRPRPDFDPAEPDARAWTEAIAEAARRERQEGAAA
jgi:hypothetical protein